MPKTILAVDDSATVRQLVCRTLADAGYRVIEAADGEEGLHLARKEAVSLVLAAQDAPRVDGLSLVKSLRAMPRYRSAPLLLLATESSDYMRARGCAAGATGWLVKPIDPPRLLDVVQRVLGASGARPVGSRQKGPAVRGQVAGARGQIHETHDT